MKSSITATVPIEKIEVPSYYYDIHLTNWKEVENVYIQATLQRLNIELSKKINELSDEEVANLRVPHYRTVEEMRRYARALFKRTQIDVRFYQQLLPYLMTYIADGSQVVLNAEERDEFIYRSLSEYTDLAQEEGLTLLEFVSNMMDKAEDPMAALREKLEEEFIFRLVAFQYYIGQGRTLDEVDYEAFIQHHVLESQADEITLRERFNYEQYRRDMPSMIMTNELYEYYVPKFRFVEAMEEKYGN